MRPTKLVITGFCSYSDRTEIDLDKLGTSGLYLITGKTGSGKTTIFDAITYALYGEPSGKNRETSMLRSSNAGVDTPTEVELTFELRDKTYYIKRNPTYQRLVKKGEGLTTESANVILKMPDGKIHEGSKIVDKKIVELLGIEKDQFSQIVMLAQGDFQKLLSEKSEARQQIFRKIFKTEKYEQLQKQLVDRKVKLGKKVDELSASLKQYYAGTYCDEDNVLNIELEKAKKTDISWEEKISILEKIIAEDEAFKTKLEEDAKTNQTNIEKKALEISDAEAVINAKEDFQKKEIEIKGHINHIAELKADLDEKTTDFNNNAEREKQKTLIQNDLTKYGELKNLQEEVEKLTAVNTSLAREIDNLNSKITAKTDDISNKEKELNTLETEGDKTAALTIAQSNLNTKLSDITEFQTAYRQYKENCSTHKSIQEEYLKISRESQEAQNKYQEANKAFLDGQAGVLAETLKENEPCPVCGSVHHPSPAKKAVTVPDEKELKSLKEAAEALNAKATNKSNEASELSGTINNQKKTIEGSIKTYFSDVQEAELEVKITDSLENLRKELKQISEEISLAEKQAERIKKLKEELPALRSELEGLNKTVADKQNQVAVNDNSLLLYGNQIKAVKENLMFDSKEAAEEKIKNLSNEISSALAAHEKATVAVSDANIQLAKMNTELDELKKTIGNDNKIDLETLRTEKRSLDEKAAELSDEIKTVFARIKTNTSAVENIKPNSVELIETQKKQRLVKEISDTANGNLGQKTAKIMLETYVQMHYFDRIIAHANKRFMIMSSGQYELIRKKDVDNYQSQTGLELNVIDHHKGKERDVKSLSGGESFEASLSLALGLSDEISESAGGIKIDSMFVDEGFGTLDSDTLQKAYNALIGITEGNRLVGIISHVDYLKEKVDKQLVITKEIDKGSSVTIKC